MKCKVFPPPSPFHPPAQIRALSLAGQRGHVCAPRPERQKQQPRGMRHMGPQVFPQRVKKRGEKRGGGGTSFSNAPATTKCNFNKCWRRNTLTSSPWRKYIHLYTQTHTHKHIHTTSMLARAFQRSSVRQFSASAKQLSGPHFPEGVYNNLPFKVKNRRIPYAVPHLIFWIAGCGIPFFAVYVQQKRAGNL